MKRIDFTKSRLLLAVLVPLCPFIVGTAAGADELSTTTTTNTTSTVNQQPSKSAELANADARSDAARAKLENAKKVLNAAKASLKAADAEYKASRADRDALALRETATQLADASGFGVNPPVEPIRQIIVPPTGNRLTPVNAPISGATPVMMTQTTTSVVGAAAAPGKPLADFNSAPAPSNDLQSNPVVEPNPVP